MEVFYLGTGAAEGIPAMFCSCDFCTKTRLKGRAGVRTRSQIVIDGDLSIDFPPEAYTHSLEFDIDLSSMKYVIFTHSHMDHCYAHDFILRGYKYAKLKEPQIKIYGNEEVLKVFAECTGREMKPEVFHGISLTKISAYQELFIGPYRILTIPARHDVYEESLLFYVEKEGKGYLHLYDTGPFDLHILNFLKEKGAKADLVSFDCTLVDKKAEPGARHMGIENDMEVRDYLLSLGVCTNGTKFVITHYSHNGSPTDEKIKSFEEKYDVISAYDGMKVEI